MDMHLVFVMKLTDIPWWRRSPSRYLVRLSISVVWPIGQPLSFGSASAGGDDTVELNPGRSCPQLDEHNGFLVFLCPSLALLLLLFLTC